MDHIGLLRKFSRSCTATLGLLDRQLSNSPLSFTESRVIYEIAQQANLTANSLSQDLSLDKGYLSKILKKLKRADWITDEKNPTDKRSSFLLLTEKGQQLFATIDRGSEEFYSRLLQDHSPFEKSRLTLALGEASQLLLKSKNKPKLEDIQIRRTLQPGDIGWVIQSHGEMYELDHQFGLEFEKYVSTSISEYWEIPTPNRNTLWICEHEHNRVGFLMLLDRGESAQLRYFFIYPAYRGIGLGRLLMEQFMTYFKAHQFGSCYLWTTHQLTDAAALYQRFGFTLKVEKATNSFGIALREQRYEYWP